MSFAQKKYSPSGKSFLPARVAAQKLACAQDYVGKLCREGKLDCARVDGAWLVEEDSISAFEKSRKTAKASRAQELSLLRHEENTLRRKMLSTKHAARMLGCAPDYIGKLCREGKLEGVRVKSAWFVSAESLAEFETQRDWQRALRAQELSDLRRSEIAEYQSVDEEDVEELPTPVRPVQKRNAPQENPLFKGAAFSFGVVLLFASVLFAADSFSGRTAVGQHVRTAVFGQTPAEQAAALAQLESPFFGVHPTAITFTSGGSERPSFFARLVAFLFEPAEPQYAALPEPQVKPAEPNSTPAVAQTTINNTTNNYTTNNTNHVTNNTYNNSSYTIAGAVQDGSLVTKDFFDKSVERIFDVIARSNDGGGITEITDADVPDDITASNYLALSGGTLTGALNNTATATSTFAGGIALTGGCISLNGTCIGNGSGTPGGSDGQIQFNNSGAFGGSSNLTFDSGTGLLGFAYASGTAATTTSFFSSTSSSTNLFTSNFSIGSLTGLLQANNGLVSASSTLSVQFGGTGTSSAPTYGQLLVGDGVGGYAFFATSSLGLGSGTWGSIGGTLDDQTDLKNILDSKISSTSLSGASVIAYDSSTGVITTQGGTFGAGSYVFPSNLTINGNSLLGTVTSGIWNGSAIGATYGGTGLTTVTQNGLLIGAGGNAWTQVGTSSLNIALADTTGTLTVARGGTGANTLSGLLLGNGTSAITGTTLSADLSGALSDETGSGALVFSTNAQLSSTTLLANTLLTYATSTSLNTGLLGVGGSQYFTSLLGTGLTNTSGALSVTLSAFSTTNLSEGSNLYFTDARVGSYISGSSTIPHVGGSEYGDILQWSGSAWATAATSALGVALSDTTGTLDATRGGTGLSSFVTGDILYADSNSTLTRLPVGSAGQVLKVQAGLPAWGVDQTIGGGGSDGIFATSSGRIYPLDTSSVVLIGTDATSTANSIFEVSGQQYISTRLAIATTSPSSGAALAVSGAGYFTGGLGVGVLNTVAGTLQTSGNATIGGALTLGSALTVANGGTGSTTLTGLLVGNGTGSLLTATVSGPLAFSGSTLSIAQANGSTDGYLSSADWTLFNNKISSSSLAQIFPFTPTTFGSTAANATSTLIGFSNGIYSLASSTIGGGTQTTGLTISGGATTTGNAYVAGNLTVAGSATVGQLASDNYFGQGDFFSFNADGTGSILFKTNNIERFAIYSSGANEGNVGIGTSSPGQKLSVAGDILGNNIIGSYFTATTTTASVLPYASSTALTVSGTGYFGTASTSNLTISNIASGSLLKTTTAGVVTAAVAGTDYTTPTQLANAFPFTTTTFGSTVANATSTLIGFNSGIYSLASSTVGGGTQTTGLTISGGATTTGNAYVAGTGRFGSTLSLANVLSCTGGQALQTNSSGDISCGTISISGISTAGGWTTNSVGDVLLATTSDRVGIGATTTSYAKLSVLSGAAGTTTLALVPFTGQTANILDIYNTSGALSSVFTATGRLGLGTTSPSQVLSVAGSGVISESLGIGTTSPYAKLSVAGGNIVHVASGAPTLAASTSTVDVSYLSYVSGNYAYVADNGGGLKIIDITNPKSPVTAGIYSAVTTVRSVAVAGKYAYVGDSDTGLNILDVSNPSSPTLVGAYAAGGRAFTMALSGRYVFLPDVLTGTLRIVDVANPANPILAGSYSTGGSGEPYAIAVSGKYAYLGDQGTNDIYVLDISNIANPTLVSTYSTGVTAPTNIYLSGKYAYVSDAGGGFYILDTSNPAALTLVGSYSTSASYYGVQVAGGYAYLANNVSGTVVVLDVSNITTPTLVGTYSGATAPRGIVIAGKYVYVADLSGGLKILDINGIQAPAATIGAIQTNILNVTDSVNIGGDIYAGGGLNVGLSGIFSRGGLASFGSSTLATTTISSLTVGGLSGLLQATNGIVSATSTLSVQYGGTGSTTLSGLLVGNGTGSLLSATVSGPLAFSGSTLSIAQANGSTDGYLSSADWTLFNNKISSSSLAQIFPFTPTTFGSTAANATSTLIGFSNGIYSLASSTIGGGTQTTGLTISGGATTTGSAYFGNSLYLTKAGDNQVGFISTTSRASFGGNDGTTVYGAYMQMMGANYNGGSSITSKGGAEFVIDSRNNTTQFNVLSYNGTSWSQPMLTVLSSGEVGIGSSTPYAKLSVKGAGTGTGVNFQTTNSSNVPLVTMLDNGNVGIGTTSPGQKLSVAGNILGNNIIGSYFTATSTTATSSFANGINITDGCFAMDNSCITLGSLGGTLGVANGGTGSTTLSGLLVGNGTGSLLTATVSGPLAFSGSTLSITQSSGSTSGYLSSADWTLFNNKISSSSLAQIFPFTPTTNYGAAANSTSTPLWFTNGFQASSTARLVYASTTALTVSGNAYFPGSGIWNSSGKVGIGVTNPTAQLNVGSAKSLLDTDEIAQFGTSDAGAGTGYITVRGLLGDFSGTAMSTLKLGATSDAGGDNVAFFDALAEDVNATPQSTSIAFRVSGTERMRIVGSSGNVGLGTTSPGQKLSVAGNILGNQIIGSYFTATTTTASVLPYASSTALTVSGTGYFGTASTSNLTISNIASGSLLKTTTAGVVTAAVAGTDYATVAQIASAFPFTPTTNYGAAANSTSTPLWFTNGFQASSTARLVYASTTALTVSGNAYFPSGVWNSSGNVGIGTTTPVTQLDIANASATSTLRVFGANGYGAKLSLLENANAVSGNGGYGFDITYDGTANTLGFTTVESGTPTLTALTLRRNNGNLGVGSTSPFANLSVHANNGGTNTTLFAIGSSTATATTSLFRVLNSGGVIVGDTAGLITTSTGGFDATPGVQVVAGGADASTLLYRYGANANPARTFFLKTRGTTASDFAAVEASDQLGAFSFAGGNGTSAAEGAQIRATVTETNSGTAYTATELGFFTSPGGATAPQRRLTIYADGNVGVGTSTPYGVLSVTNTGTGPSFVVEDSASPDATPFIIDASGNVGIGNLTASRLVATDASKNLVSTITLANLASSISDVTGTTGTGNLVLSAAPTFTGTTNFANIGVSGNSTLGTVTSGIWNGSAIGGTYGGTGLTSVTQNSLLIGAAGNTWTQVATSSLGIALSDTTGILSIAKGGTATSTQVTNGVNYFDGTKITSGTALTYNGTTFTAPYASSTALSVSGNAYLTNTTNSGTLGVTGAATFSSTLAVTGAVTLSSTLGVSGKTTLASTTIDENTTSSSGNTVLLTVGGDQTAASTGGFYAANFVPRYTAASGNTLASLYGAQFNPVNTSTGDITSMFGIYAVGQNSGGGTVGTLRGVWSAPSNSSGTTTSLFGVQSTPATSNGTTTTQYGFYTNSSLNGSGAVTTHYGVYADPSVSSAGSGTVTNQYGLFVRGGNNSSAGGVATNYYQAYLANPLTTGTITNPVYGIYQQYTSALNYFGGNVGLNATDPDKALTIAATTTDATYGNQISLRSQRTALVANSLVGGVEFRSNDTNLTTPGTVTASLQAVANVTHTASALGTDLVFSGTTGTTFAELMRLTGAGNLGVGTTSPGSLLSIGGVANFTAATSTFYGTGGINLAAGCYAINGTCLDVSDFGGTLAIANGGTNATTQTTNGVNYFNGTSITSGTDFNYNGTNVGIGSTSPSKKLTVLGSSVSSAIGQAPVRIGVTTASSVGLELGTYGGGFGMLQGITHTTNAAGMVLLNPFGGSVGVGTTTSSNYTFSVTGTNYVTGDAVFGGNIGIGSSTPASPLSIYTSNDAAIRIDQVGSSWNYMQFLGDGVRKAAVGIDNLEDAFFGVYTNSGADFYKALTIDSSAGNIGLGTSTPWGMLSINPDGITGPAFAIGSSTGGTKFVVTNGGRVGIGTTSPSAIFNVFSTTAVSGLLERGTEADVALQFKNTADSAYVGVNSEGNFAVSTVSNLTTSPSLVVDMGTGYVGVGTSTPSTHLAVVGSGWFTSGLNVGGSPTAGLGEIISSGDATFGGEITVSGVNASTFAGVITSTATAANTFPYASTTALTVSGSAYFDNGTGIWDSSGKVGIGTTTPAAKLDIYGNNANTQLSLYSGNDGKYPYLTLGRTSDDMTIAVAASAGQWAVGAAAGDTVIRTEATTKKLFLSTGTTPAMTINNSNIGIGTTTPVSLLNVADTAAPKITISDTNAPADQKHWFMQSNTGAFSIGTTSDALATNASYRALTITSTGNVGIGTTSPGQALSVAGTGYFTGDTTVGGNLVVSGSATVGQLASDNYFGQGDVFQFNADGSGAIIFKTNSIETLYIPSTGAGAGNVGIGTTTPGQKLSVAGDILGNNIIGSYFTGTSTTASTFAGNVAANAGINVAGADITAGAGVELNFAAEIGSKINLFNTTYGIGITSGETNWWSNGVWSWRNGSRTGTEVMNLSAAGDLQTDGVLTVSGTSASTFAGVITSTATAANTFPYASTTALTVSGSAYFPGSGIWDSVGNVGIGTTTPTSLLNVAGATNPKITITDTDSAVDQKHWFIENSNGEFNIGTTSDAGTTGTYRGLTIEANGEVGVGTINPIASFDIGRDTQDTRIFNISAVQYSGVNNIPAIDFAGIAVYTGGTNQTYINMNPTLRPTAFLSNITGTTMSPTIDDNGGVSASMTNLNGLTVAPNFAAGYTGTVASVRGLNLNLTYTAGTITDYLGILLNGNSVASSTAGIVIGDYTSPLSNVSILTGTTAPPAGNWDLYLSADYPSLFVATSTTFANDKILLKSQRAGIVSGSYLGGIGFVSDDTNLTIPGVKVAGIQAVAAGTHNGTSQLTDLIFTTTATGGTATNTEKVRITGAGYLGIGTSTPNAMLTVGSAAAGGNVRVGNGWLCVDNNDTCTGATTAGTVYAVGAYTTGADLAEQYPTLDDTLVPGEIVSFDVYNNIHVVRAAGEASFLGVISTAPGVLLNGYKGDIGLGSSTVPVALAGRVPVKVSLEGGAISIGDRLMLSSIPGVAKKATESGQTIGVALEPYTSSATSSTVLVFIDPQYTFAQNVLEVLHEIAAASEATSTDAGGDATTTSATSTTQVFTSIILQALAQLGVTLENGIARFMDIFADHITTNTLTVGSTERPAGITLFDKITGEPYCLEVVDGDARTTPGECVVGEQAPAPEPDPTPEAGGSEQNTNTDTGTDTASSTSTTSATSTPETSTSGDAPAADGNTEEAPADTGTDVGTSTGGASGDTVPVDTSTTDTSATDASTSAGSTGSSSSASTDSSAAPSTADTSGTSDTSSTDSSASSPDSSASTDSSNSASESSGGSDTSSGSDSSTSSSSDSSSGSGDSAGSSSSDSSGSSTTAE